MVKLFIWLRLKFNLDICYKIEIVVQLIILLKKLKVAIKNGITATLFLIGFVVIKYNGKNDFGLPLLTCGAQDDTLLGSVRHLGLCNGRLPGFAQVSRDYLRENDGHAVFLFMFVDEICMESLASQSV